MLRRPVAWDRISLDAFTAIFSTPLPTQTFPSPPSPPTSFEIRQMKCQVDLSETDLPQMDPLKMDDLPCGGFLCPVALHRSHNRSLLLYDPASFDMRITCVGDRGDTVVAWSSPPNEATCTSNGEKDPLKMDDLPCDGGVCPVALHRSHMHSLLLYNLASFDMRITCV